MIYDMQAYVCICNRISYIEKKLIIRVIIKMHKVYFTELKFLHDNYDFKNTVIL